uniref:Tetraspanin n=1 Tax=Tetraodon nigroviridis TaxID=99883 RepID=H3DHI2_TETNG
MSPPSRRLQTKPVITCLKTFLVSYSLIFWFTGVILLAVGVWGKVSLESYFSLASEDSTNAPYVLIGTGAAIIIFGLFGCATCRGSPWMLKLYAMFLTLMFLAELVAGISGFVFRHEIKAKLKVAFENDVMSYNSSDSSSSSTSSVVDTIQRSLHCCGVKNFTDWGETLYFKEKGIPTSCCKDTTKCSPETLKDLDKAATEGCFTLVTNVMEANLGIIAGISFGIAFFQLIGIFLSCCLSRYITNNQYEMV